MLRTWKLENRHRLRKLGNLVGPTPVVRSSKKTAPKKPAKGGCKHDAPNCVACKVSITDDTPALNCDGCGEIWKCSACLGLDEDIYDLLVHSAASLKWLCDKCDSAISNRDMKMPDKVMEILEEILQRSKTIEERLSNIEATMEEKADKATVCDLERRMEALEHKISDELEVDLKKMNDQMKNVVVDKGEEKHNHLVKLDTNISDNVELSLKEMEDRSRRKENLVIFNVPESSSEDREERKLYDISEVVDIFKDLKIDTPVSNPVRLGLKTSDSKYPRPLRVTVPDEETKWRVVKEAKNLATTGKENHVRVFIKRDMTRFEREQDATLRKKLMEMRKNEEDKGGKDQWTIWRGKVVKKRN